MHSQFVNRDAKIAQAEAALLLAKDSADILLAADGNLVQNILIDEGVLATSANVKDALRRALVDRPKQIRESLPLSIGSILPPSPFETGVAPFLKKTKQEENAQELIGKISASIPRPSPPSLPGVSTIDGVPFATESSTRGDSSIDPEQAAMVAKEVRENLPKYAPLVGQLGGKVSNSGAARLPMPLKCTVAYHSLTTPVPV